MVGLRHFHPPVYTWIWAILRSSFSLHNNSAIILCTLNPTTLYNDWFGGAFLWFYEGILSLDWENQQLVWFNASLLWWNQTASHWQISRLALWLFSLLCVNTAILSTGIVLDMSSSYSWQSVAYMSITLSPFFRSRYSQREYVKQRGFFWLWCFTFHKRHLCYKL